MTASSERKDERAEALIGIVELFERLTRAWNAGDGMAYGELFTVEAHYVPATGETLCGREAIAASHQALFDRCLRGSRRFVDIESVRFLTPTVAVVHAHGTTVPAGSRVPATTRQSVQTFVAVETSCGWRFTAFHDCLVQDSEASDHVPMAGVGVSLGRGEEHDQ